MDQSSHTKTSCALLLVNERARSGQDALACAQESLTQKGIRVIAPKFQKPEQFKDLIARHANEIDFVVVGGGDGSIRAAVPGLLAHDLPLAILPLGTANNLARNLQIPTSIEEACEMLIVGEPRDIDVAEVNGVYFLNVAGLGLSVKVNRTVPHDLKKRWGVFGYAATAYRAWKNMRPFRADLVCDGEIFRLKSQQITVCNGRHFGSGLIIQPDAQINDGFFDVVSLNPRTWRDIFSSARALFFGHHAETKAMKRFKVRDLEIRTKKRLWIDTDGEVLTQTPARFRLHERSLKVLAPRLEKERATDGKPEAASKRSFDSLEVSL